MGAARTVLVIVSGDSVTMDWPLLEMNTALGFEASGAKTVIPVMVGKPDLSQLPLIRGKRWIVWNGDPMAVAKVLRDAVKGKPPEPVSVTVAKSPPKTGSKSKPAVPVTGGLKAATDGRAASVPRVRKSWLRRLFGG